MCKLINERNEQLVIFASIIFKGLTKNCSNYYGRQYLLIIIHVHLYDRLQLIANMSGDISYFVLMSLDLGIENRSVKTLSR